MQYFVRHVCQRLCLQNRSKLSRHYPYVQSAIVGVSVVVMIVIVMVIISIDIVIAIVIAIVIIVGAVPLGIGAGGRAGAELYREPSVVRALHDRHRHRHR